MYQSDIKTSGHIWEKQKIVQVCKEKECDKTPTEPITIGNETHIFCCQKGFEKSLKDFAEFVGR